MSDTLVAAYISGVFILIGWLVIVTWNLAQMKLMVNTMWQSSLQRGQVDGIKREKASFRSPYTIDPEALAWFSHDGFVPILRAFYKTCPQGITDSDLALKIQRVFGVRLLKEIYEPHGIDTTFGLVVAVAVAKNTNTVDMGSDKQTTVAV